MREHLLMNFFDWLRTLSQDADSVREGFQPNFLYIIWNVVFPWIFGVAVALFIGSLGRVVPRFRRRRAE